MAPADRPPRCTQHPGDVANRRAWPEVRCSRRDRHGRLHLGRLAAQHGADGASTQGKVIM
jgi:hypothetical protein